MEDIWYTLACIVLFILFLGLLLWFVQSFFCYNGRGRLYSGGGGGGGGSGHSSHSSGSSDFATFYAVDGCNAQDPNFRQDNPAPIPAGSPVLFLSDGPARSDHIIRSETLPGSFLLKKKGKYYIEVVTNVQAPSELPGFSANLVVALQNEDSLTIVEQAPLQASALFGGLISGVFAIEIVQCNVNVSIRVPTNASAPLLIFPCAGDVDAQLPTYSWLRIRRV